MKHNAAEHDMPMPEEKPKGEVVCQMCGMSFVSEEERDKHNAEVHPSM